MAALKSDSFEACYEKERELAQALVTSGQPKALQYAFCAERTASKVDQPIQYHELHVPHSTLDHILIACWSLGDTF